MKIAISSGKGGTGKTFIATNLAVIFKQQKKPVVYLDCDVEAPNGHLFLKPKIQKEQNITLSSPVGINDKRCVKCGKCAAACTYNAIAATKDKVLFFSELCHACGACELVCPTEAIVIGEKKIGVIKHGKSRSKIDFHYALLKTAEGGMSPRLIEKVKACSGPGINFYDSPPGTACPVVTTVKNTDLCVLVTDPTPFGVNDLKLAVKMCRKLGQEPVVLVNRAAYLDDKLKQYCGQAKLEIIAEIPDDRRIAEVYAKGEMVIDVLPEYALLFKKIAEKLIRRAQNKKKVIMPESFGFKATKTVKAKTAVKAKAARSIFKEMVIISGKGGTGKTSLTACFAALAGQTVITDCDVDAADLHLILDPKIIDHGLFSGGFIAEIDPNKCTGCGKCKAACRFSAINIVEKKHKIDPLACEGCGVCRLVCKDAAVKTRAVVNGEWYVSNTRFGPLSHARLGIAKESSGRLVTFVRQKAAKLVSADLHNQILSDGAPGTGCPVIASLTGVHYALIVTEPTVSGIHDLKRILEVTRHFGIKVGVVVNKYDLNQKMAAAIKNQIREYQADFLGIIPYDKNVLLAQTLGLSLVEYGRGDALKYINNIWSKIRKETVLAGRPKKVKDYKK